MAMYYALPIKYWRIPVVLISNALHVSHDECPLLRATKIPKILVVLGNVAVLTVSKFW